MNLRDLFPDGAHEAAVENKHVRIRPHFSEPYLIHNYTEACVWESAWNPVTTTCRGLITHADTGDIIARPFPKFWNVGQPEAASFDPDAPVTVTEKADGSLGILYPLSGGGWAISTRGSFHSAQADWATTFYNTNHQSFEPNPAWTYLFEIIYADNRIVVDYGDFEGLVLLGAVDIETGRSIPLENASAGWDGPVIETHPYRSLREVLTTSDREDREGFVVHNPVTDERVKVKHETYMRLHKLLTNTTEKHVWEVLANGDSPAAVFASAPDEFHQWLRIIERRFTAAFMAADAVAHAEYTTVITTLNNTYGKDGWSRKEFAEQAKRTSTPALMFLLHDGQDIAPRIWQNLKPVGETSSLRIESQDSN